jgi:hypothetical protein
MLLKYGASLFNIDGRGLSLYDVAEKKVIFFFVLIQNLCYFFS